MSYKFVIEAQDYTDFSSGRVFYTLPGRPAFPVRLMSEAFQRSCVHLTQDRYHVYDPCCGTGYHLAVLGYLHGAQIQAITASDIDVDVLDVATRNLSLLTDEGLAQRIHEIEQMIAMHGGKTSHHEALESAWRFEQALPTFPPMLVHSFVANSFDAAAVQQGLNGRLPNLVFADVPYGQHSRWVGAKPNSPALQQFFDCVQIWLPADAVLVIAADKRQKLRHERFTRLEKFQVGKRQIGIFRVKE